MILQTPVQCFPLRSGGDIILQAAGQIAANRATSKEILLSETAGLISVNSATCKEILASVRNKAHYITDCTGGNINIQAAGQISANSETECQRDLSLFQEQRF